MLLRIIIIVMHIHIFKCFNGEIKCKLGIIDLATIRFDFQLRKYIDVYSYYLIFIHITLFMHL